MVFTAWIACGRSKRALGRSAGSIWLPWASWLAQAGSILAALGTLARPGWLDLAALGALAFLAGSIWLVWALLGALAASIGVPTNARTFSLSTLLAAIALERSSLHLRQG